MQTQSVKEKSISVKKNGEITIDGRVAGNASITPSLIIHLAKITAKYSYTTWIDTEVCKHVGQALKNRNLLLVNDKESREAFLSGLCGPNPELFLTTVDRLGMIPKLHSLFEIAANKDDPADHSRTLLDRAISSLGAASFLGNNISLRFLCFFSAIVRETQIPHLLATNIMLSLGIENRIIDDVAKCIKYESPFLFKSKEWYSNITPILYGLMINWLSCDHCSLQYEGLPYISDELYSLLITIREDMFVYANEKVREEEKKIEKESTRLCQNNSSTSKSGAGEKGNTISDKSISKNSKATVIECSAAC